MKGKFQIFPAKVGFGDPQFIDWYWRYRSNNGKIMATGGEAFSSVNSARRSITNFCKNLNTFSEPIVQVVRKRK